MLIELVLITFLLLFLSTYGLVLYRRLFLLPPGPFPLPLLGNLHQLDLCQPQKTCQEWAKQYGPVFTVWFATQPMVMITDYEMMKDALVKHGDQLSSRPKVYAFDYFHRGNFGIVVSTGELWKEQRRFSLLTLRNFGLGRNIMEDRIMTQAKYLAASLIEDMDARGRLIADLSLPINLCVGSVVSSILFGHTFEKGDPQFALLKETLDEDFKVIASLRVLMMNSFPWLRHVPLFRHFGMDDLKEHDEIVRGFMTAQLNRHIADLDERMKKSDESEDFIEAYLREMKRRQTENEPMSYFCEWQLLCSMSDLFIAGLETTVTTLRWAILAMMKYPDIQAKIHDEIDRTIGRVQIPSMSDRQSMPYMVAALNEVQRWGNILPINVFHSNDVDFQLGAYRIPKNITVIPQISTLAIDERVFPQPDQFRPERFLEPDGKTPKKIEEFAPFSMGKRQCLGEGLARAELFLIFVHLMQRFRFAIPDGAEEPTIKPELGFTSAPHPHECLVTLR